MLGNDTSATSIVHFFIFLQLPIVSFLTYFSFQAARSPLNLQPFVYIRYGWLSNIVYLLMLAIFSEQEYNGHLIGKIFFYGLKSDLDDTSLIVYKTVTHFFDLLGCYFIFRGTRHFLVQKKWFSSLFPYKPSYILLIFSALLLSEIITKMVTNHYVHIMYTILYSFVTFITYICLASYFKTFHNKYGKIKSLYFGATLFAYIQFLIILFLFFDESNVWINSIGFLLGFISKCAIVYGLHELFLIYIKNSLDYELIKSQSNKLHLFLGKTFHEINKPIDAISSTVEEIEKFEQLFHVSKKIKSRLTHIQQANNHMYAIVSSSSLLLSHGNIDLEHNFRFNTSINDDKEFKYHNLNTIIETAIVISRKYLSDNQKIYSQYSKNCTLFCNLDDVLQIALNLLKNSVETIPPSGEIMVKTLNIEVNTEKWVAFEIEDNGPGITFEVRDFIFDEGFTTKTRNEIGRGFGLPIVRSIINYYKGKIELMSPTKFGVGTRFTIKIPCESKFNS